MFMLLFMRFNFLKVKQNLKVFLWLLVFIAFRVTWCESGKFICAVTGEHTGVHTCVHAGLNAQNTTQQTTALPWEGIYGIVYDVLL